MLKKVVFGVVRNGRKFLNGIINKGEGTAKPGAKPEEIIRADGFAIRKQARLFQRGKDAVTRPSFGQNFAKYTRKTLASELRLQFNKSPVYGKYRGLAAKLSMYAFVGVGFATCNQDERDFDSVCENIRNIFAVETGNDPFENLRDHGLKDYHLGPMIAKGCNAAVYAAKHNAFEESECETDEVTDTDSSGIESSEEILEQDTDSDIDSDIEVIEDDMPPATFFVPDESVLQSSDIDEKTAGFVCVGEEELSSDVEIIEEDGDPAEIIFLITCQQEEARSAQHRIRPCKTEKQTYDPKLEHTRAQQSRTEVQTSAKADSVQDLGLAIKMIFNYDIDSNAEALYRGLEKEMLPARAEDLAELLSSWHNGHREREKAHLPPHPNIVEMYGGFVDEVPVLPEGMEEYPAALPGRINPDGHGRNKTLFLVMKRYPCTLREYLSNHPDLSVHQATLLLTQLVQAVVHMTDHRVAHRDLKSDNIFVETVGECPHLVVSDFGDCLQTDDEDLRLSYTTNEISKGGNAALMAPEIALARPGHGSFLDYSKSDLWTVGTLAYEIFGQKNPFYNSRDGTKLHSTTYKQDDLPELGNHVPEALQVLIKKMLNTDPKLRPTPSQVETYLHLLLWSPADWELTFRSDQRSRPSPSTLDIIGWLLISTAHVLMEWRSSDNCVEHQMRTLFLSRVNFMELEESLQLLYNE